MRDWFGSIGFIASGFFLLLGLFACAAYFHLGVYQGLAPRYAQVERQVFKHTPSYIEGKIGDLVRYRAQYQTAADAEHRAALKQVILGTASAVDRAELPPDLREFVDGLGRGTP